MSSNSVCNHTRDKQIGLQSLRGYHSYDYRPNWTPLGPMLYLFHFYICANFSYIRTMDSADTSLLAGTFLLHFSLECHKGVSFASFVCRKKNNQSATVVSRGYESFRDCLKLSG